MNNWDDAFRRCNVRQPVEIKGRLQAGGFTAEANGLTPLVQSANNNPDPANGVVGLSYLSFTTTNGADFFSAVRTIEIALVDGSRKLRDAAGVLLPANPCDTILFAGTVATYFQQFDMMPLPRDSAGPELQQVRWKVSGAPSGFDWSLKIGVVDLLTVGR